ncbi:anaerobic ribonucleoside-triphosphate reductase [Klebsiella phage phiKp_21]|nr:anaerobic ribonucleoside-triphosphate reductase [Klebsiella phage phiKp_21]
MNPNKLYEDIENLINNTNKDITTENANKDAKVVNTHRDLLAGILSKHYAQDNIPEEFIKWHNDGYGHYHDLDYYISPLTNCCLINYPDMLRNGFKIGSANIEEPKSFSVACTVLTQIVQAVASSQYGGQSLAHIDKYLEPYVQMSWNKLLEKQKKYNLSTEFIEDELRKEVYDGCQTFLYQLNSTVSVSGQTPFISISLGLSTTKFGRLITEQYLKVHEKGLGKDGITPVFPKVIFFLEDGINANSTDPNYDLKQQALHCSSKRIYPDFVSVKLNKEITGSTTEAVTPMSCRSFLSKWINENGEEQYNGRCNLGVASINLPLIALESTSDDVFFDKLHHHMDMAYRFLSLRVERLKGTKARQNPVLYMYGALARLDPDETIEQLFYNGRSSISIGYVGLSECSEILKGKIDKDFGLKVLKYMQMKCNQYKEETNIAYSLYGTPAESLCYKFAKAINEKYPSVLNRDYISNSFHYPVHYDISIFDKFEYESLFGNISSGGNISYVETPNLSNNLKALETIVDYASTKVQYFGINQPVDHCYKCGYDGQFNVDKNGYNCPHCGNNDESTISVCRRVSGYLGAPNSRPFNNGKQSEVISRRIHK